MKNRGLVWVGILFALTGLVACGQSQVNQENSDTGAVSGTESEESDIVTEEAESENGKLEAIRFSEEGVAVTEQRFLSANALISITYPDDAVVYYTTDGSEPNQSSQEYTEPIDFRRTRDDFPNCMVLKARAYYGDGSESEIVTHTFFNQFRIEERFETIVFSISGNPDELTEGPEGIMYGDNAKERGDETEREVYIEAMNSDGSVIFEQGAGVRVYGGASRGLSIKSLKLYARREYDADHGKFDLDVFDTIGADGDVITGYDKLVLRNCGNDFQFAYIRDELNQRLAAQAGYTNCEGVVPAVVYLNGEYYGLFWLHESYCNDFFEDKYGKGTGYYEVLEGAETWKSADEDDPENAAACEEFGRMYNKLAYSDLTDEDNYEELCAFIDVENYLQYYAFNIYINNNDWPQNNYKCYRYYAGEGEEYGEGEMDGRWRFLFHDMDYSYGLYGQNEVEAHYNNLKYILDKNSNRYSPLFANLMKRDDCRQYFLDETERLMNDVLSEENIISTLDEMNAERENEMKYFYEHLESMKSYDESIWSWYDEYLNRVENIRKFARARAGYMERYLEESFGK